ncbi:hypothetical protein [Lacihabitans soyangensis]|uniref:Uncharacterized protein n=1 Tax=Lacihabitans soyangensis TaxID=869394 RepID=A0AAE3H719_9BACT|nr:hypothetical protein [Lacihabitans soyangensis]MCP9765181.1 hypothetical protein [Lacihabitans soyangensis]
MARITGVSVQEWIDFNSQSFMPGMVLQVADGQIMAPANSAGIGGYDAAASAAATNGSSPGSIFEGMQTIARLARTRSGYNPLDPEGMGNKQHFIQFTQNIASAPMLDLLKADTQDVINNSQNSDSLINSFVDAFIGISTENVGEITKAVSNLAKAALSYSDKIEKYSNFAQNLLQVDSSGNVQFHLYASTFGIHTTESKGTVTFHSEYSVSRAVYQLSPAAWNACKEYFNQQQNTDTNSWINSMTTPVKANGGARALCIERMLRRMS